MDVDVLHRKAAPEGSCFRCGKVGHFGKNCPDRFDIRLMMADEVQEVLENKLAQLDAVPEEETAPGETHQAETMDFPKDNK